MVFVMGRRAASARGRMQARQPVPAIAFPPYRPPMLPVRPFRAAIVAALVALGACTHRAGEVTAPERTRPVALAAMGAETPPVIITERMAIPSVADAVGEYLEVFNPGSVAVDMSGWTIRSFSTESHTIAGSLVVPPCGVAVLVNNGNSAT